HIPVIWATRALRHVSPIADRIVVLGEGELVTEGTSDRIMVAPGPSAEPVVEASVGHTVAHGIDELYHELLAMGSRAERAVHQAVQALTDQNLSIAREIVDEDQGIDD